MNRSILMHGHTQLSFVLLSITIAILSAYAALDLAGRVTSSRTRSSRLCWLLCGSVAMGIGIWSMHYVGMLGYRMDMPVLYDWPTVLLSMLAAAFASALALFMVSRPTLGWIATAVASLFMGGGIAAMHYTGMAAMRMEAAPVYDMYFVTLSVVAALAISFVALRLTFATRHIRSMFNWRKSVTALVMGLAIPVMHYLGMAAVSFRHTPLTPEQVKHAVGISDLGATSIVLVTVMLLSLVYLSSFIDRRFTSHAEALESSEERYRKIVGAAFDAFIGVSEDGLVTDWNDQAVQTFGWPARDVLGKPVSSLLSTEGEDRAPLDLPAMDANGVLHGRMEVTGVHRTGIEFPAEMAVSTIAVGQKKIFAAFVHDVTQRKSAERNMEEARITAEDANRAKSEFLANMSHEIRTPLNGVIGMTDLALETELSREQREYLTTVKFSADSLLTVINDILDFSKIEAGKVDLEAIPFDIRECVETTLKTLALRADEKGLELLCDVSADLPEIVLGDPGRLRQIIVNLVGNAIKFTSSGEVSLHVELITSSEESHQTLFTVNDTGIGIPPDKLETIFSSFSQADTSTTRQFGGTGLGLTISRRLVELMGGRIWCESRLGQGSQFRFQVSLPRVTNATATVITPHPVPLLAGVKALIVDDNKTNRRILEGLLRLWGMEVASAPDGETALRMMHVAGQEGFPYRLLLTDMHMPKMDGFMVVQQMKQDVPLALPTVMMLSSGGHHGDANRCEQLGISAYLLKPVRRQELQDAITRALGSNESSRNNKSMITQSTLIDDLPPARSLKILLAEDNEVNQKLALRLLQKRGHSVVVANNGREAVEASANQAYDLVLMDVQMPELDGIQATMRIRAREADTGVRIPIVAMTALVMKGDRERCMEADMDGYLAKPIRPQELDAVLDLYTARKIDLTESKEVVSEDAVVDADDLLERIDGDVVFVEELAATFAQDYPEKMNGLRGAVACGDADALQRTAHGLKGALANLSATRAASIAAQLERLGLRSDLTSATELIRKLEKELPRVIIALQQICRETVR